jgi:diguanylate cyclase (GGDEF)-like protein
MSHLEQALGAVSGLLSNYRGVSLILWDEKTQRFKESLSTLAEQPRNVMSQKARAGGATQWILGKRRPLIVANIADDPFTPNPMLRQHQIKGYLGVPILSDGLRFGVLYGLNQKKNQITETDQATLLASAQLIGQLIALKHESERDYLTQISSRRHFEQLVQAALEHGERGVLILADIDRFKTINDDFGHQIGDLVLQKLAQTLALGLRETDFICRFGGEEFAIFLDYTELAEGICVAERLRQAIAATEIPTPSGPIQVTISLGVTEALSCQSLGDNLARADQALYAAKRAGRNQSYCQHGSDCISTGILPIEC